MLTQYIKNSSCNYSWQPNSDEAVKKTDQRGVFTDKMEIGNILNAASRNCLLKTIFQAGGGPNSKKYTYA